MKPLFKFNYNLSNALAEDFPNIFDAIYDLDEYLAQNEGMVVSLSHIMIAVKGTEKELVTLLRRFAAEKFITLGKASFCRSHPEIVLDEQGYCMECDSCWTDEVLYKAIKIN